MSVKAEPYYWLQCDKCNTTSTEGDDYSAWADESIAVEMAENSDWLIRDEQHLCERCVSDLRCPECGEVKSTADADCPCCEPDPQLHEKAL